MQKPSVFIIAGGHHVTLNHVTLQNGHSESTGDGLWTQGNVTLCAVTISRNLAHVSGGGIENYSYLALVNATVSGNRARSSGGGIRNYKIALLNSTTAARNIGAADRDQNGSGGTYSPFDPFIARNTIIADNKNLEPLADNGGPTKTHALRAGSPAIDAGSANGCKDTSAKLLAGDQRGYFRTDQGDTFGGARCDIGAFEYNSAPILQTK